MDRVTVFETVSYKFETCMEYHAKLVLGTKSKAELVQKNPPNRTVIMLANGKTTV